MMKNVKNENAKVSLKVKNETKKVIDNSFKICSDAEMLKNLKNMNAEELTIKTGGNKSIYKKDILSDRNRGSSDSNVRSNLRTKKKLLCQNLINATNQNNVAEIKKSYFELKEFYEDVLLNISISHNLSSKSKDYNATNNGHNLFMNIYKANKK